MKIGDIASKYSVSHRSLHYWEDMGVIQSTRAENEYRYYDEVNQQKIRQILVLRKLRIPLKQIVLVLESENTAEIIDTLQQKLNDVDDEITALSTIRSIIDAFIAKLNENMMISIKANLLDDGTVLEIADSLTLTRPALKEEKSREAFEKAEDRLSKLTDQNVRILYLPPATVASALGVGNEAEREADRMMGDFVRDVQLLEINPSVRLYGFNKPVFKPNGEFVRHQYEVWATIPDGFEIPAPLTKKTFAGGLYAAYTSKPVSFEDWKLLGAWLADSEDFEYDGSRSYREDTSRDHKVRCSGWGCLEEHFNSYNVFGLKNKKYLPTHIDFLIPIKEKEAT